MPSTCLLERNNQMPFPSNMHSSKAQLAKTTSGCPERNGNRLKGKNAKYSGNAALAYRQSAISWRRVIDLFLIHKLGLCQPVQRKDLQ
ncbi:hypothetical protein Ddc_06017 [Ditylenchus destructor]|nr:hypothetical protein Ddc_06017 [Ditylenchus destructor]